MIEATELEEKIQGRQEPEWLIELREKALNAFRKIPLQEKPDSPTIKHLIRLDTIDIKKFEVMPEKGEIKFHEKKGTTIKPLMQAVKEDPEIVEKFFGKTIHFTESKTDAMHYALWKDGILIHVEKGIDAGEIITEFKGNSQTNFFHSLIVMEEGSKARITEKFSGKNNEEFLFKDSAEIIIGKNCEAEIVSVHDLNENALVFSNRKAIVEENSSLKFINACFGGKIVKQKLNVMLSEENSMTESISGFIAEKEEEIDIESNATHLSRNTKSKVLTNSVVKNSSNSVIRGLLKIIDKAVNSESDWHSNTLMLGEEAKANSLPTLEIDTNDVIAGHGSSFGSLSEEEMFYLSSRGLDEEKARKIIVQGYFEPIITKISSGIIQNEIREIIREKGF